MTLLAVLSLVLLTLSSLTIGYLYLLAFASLRRHPSVPEEAPRWRFAIAIPAHNEEGVVGKTVAAMQRMNYPSSLFDIHVVADHCTDNTAPVAAAAGAIVHIRNEGQRGGKGAALRWLFERIVNLESSDAKACRYDAVVIFDADTQVDPDFLRVMNARLTQGNVVIQGQHRISNANDSWFTSLTAAMFIVDNRFQNLGRSNLGWSAKNMGDSICLRVDVVKRFGWGEGLTEDYQFRHRLLLEGIRIVYEPTAVGYGEAPTSWAVAASQRRRWLSGTYESSRRYAWQMLARSLQRLDGALLDGALQALLPSYSSTTFIAAMMLAVHVVFRSRLLLTVGALWAVALVFIVLYPILGLVFERAPLRICVAALLGPCFVVWRTMLGLSARLWSRPVAWVRTPHGAGGLRGDVGERSC